MSNVISIAGSAEPELQIVVIDNFYDAVRQDEAMAWLGKLFRFKVESYRAHYPYGILPFSNCDFFATHWIICEKNQGILKPLMAFKSTDSARVEAFRLEFPALGLLQGSETEAHRAAIQRELKKAKEGGYPVGYLGSWGSDSSIRKNRRLALACRKISTAMFSNWIYSYDVKVAFTFASLRQNVDKVHSHLGIRRLQGADEQPLAEFKSNLFFDEPSCVSVFFRENHSQAAQQAARECAALWEKRLIIATASSPLSNIYPGKRAA